MAALELELEARPDDGAVGGAGGEDLARLSEVRDARRDVDGHAADVLADDLALAGVQADVELEAERPDRLDDRAGAAQRAGRRAVEDDEERIADGLDDVATEAFDDLAHHAL